MSTPRIPGLSAGNRWWVILLLCSVAIVPLLRSESPCTHDGAFHYFRVAAMHHALQDGTEPLRSAFTRYLPDLAFGYGYPFFNYRAALSYYLALVLHLTGLALPSALNLVYGLSIAGSGLAAYLLARDLFGSRAGIVAAVAYAYAPYQFLDALLRANMPEAVALPLLPLVLWAFRRLALTGQRRWFLLSAGSLAILLLTHNISSLLFVPFLLAYLAVLWLAYRKGERANAEGAWMAAATALALALGLTVFFWAPALLEQDYVQLYMSRVTRNNDFHYNFLGLAEILAPPMPVDTSLMNPPMRVHLGLVQAILGVVGLVTGLIPSSSTQLSRSKQLSRSGHSGWRDRERRALLMFLAFSAVAMLWMSTRASLWLWEHVPLLPFVQFPWRLVGRAILPVSLLAGASVAAIPSLVHQASDIRFQVSGFRFQVPGWASCVCYGLPVACVGLVILSALPYTYPPQGYCPADPQPTISDVFAYEHRSGLVGVDPEGSYFPVWVKQRPEGSRLEEQYKTGGPVARFDETALPTKAAVVEADYGTNQARIVVETPVSFRARYLAFYFPGWRAWVDGEPVELGATDPEGLIAFDVPAGRHTVVIRFGSTPTRIVCSIISLLSAVILIVTSLGLQPNITSHPFAPSRNHLKPEAWNLKPYALLAALLLAFKLGVVDQVDTPFRRPTLQPDDTLPIVEHSLGQPYADGLTLIGYDQDHTTIRADATLRLDLYWTARARPAARYQTVIHLVGHDGLRWSMPDSFRPRGYAKYPATTTWRPGRYALDSHDVEPLPGTPPGNYDIVLTTFDRDTLAPLSMLNERGQPTAPELTLGTVTLTVPCCPADADELGIRQHLDIPLGPVTLLGADFDRNDGAPGDSILLTTLWRASERSAIDLTVHLALLAPDDSAVSEYDLPPAARWHPTSTWQPDDVWRGQHILRLPANVESGEYTWHLSIEPIHQSTELPSTIHVTAPPHTFSPPPVDVETNTRLGNVATLVGATVEPEILLPPTAGNLKPGDTLTVTLIWRAEDTPLTSYHVFLHLLDPRGRLIAQSDGIPANWTRPTTGWLPGETIIDAHALTIPPDAPGGDYTLSTGLYVPGGKRLTADDGTDVVNLTTVAVQAQ